MLLRMILKTILVLNRNVNGQEREVERVETVPGDLEWLFFGQ